MITWRLHPSLWVLVNFAGGTCQRRPKIANRIHKSKQHVNCSIMELEADMKILFNDFVNH